MINRTCVAHGWGDGKGVSAKLCIATDTYPTAATAAKYFEMGANGKLTSRIVWFGLSRTPLVAIRRGARNRQFTVLSILWFEQVSKNVSHTYLEYSKP